MKLISAELSRPLPAVPPCSIGEQWVLVRLHGEPLGFVTPPAAGASRAQLSALILDRLSFPIVRHLAADGMAATGTLTDLARIPRECPHEPRPALRVTVAVCTRNRAPHLRACLDAMQTIGLNIAEVLVLPRVLGLVIALPLLTFFADVVGIIGGMVMTYFDLGVTIPAFMRELQGAINVKTLMVGVIKAPVFAFMIALVGCFEGMRVERNAASVGKLTTRSVVESIFLIIAADAGFSVLFSVLGI